MALAVLALAISSSSAVAATSAASGGTSLLTERQILRMGVLTGAIRRVGGAPSPNQRLPSAGDVTVYAAAVARIRRIKGQSPSWFLTGREVAHEHVTAGRYFRFKLAPGRYQIEFAAGSTCPPSTAVVRAGRTSHVNVGYACGAP